MSALDALTDEECALWAILSDRSGVDQAEFLWESQDTEDRCFRARPYQWIWWKCEDPLQADLASRSVGKSLSIKVRGFAHLFVNPGQEMLLTAPELNFLEPITSQVEEQILATRLSREMLPKGRSAVTHRPFQLVALNGARIYGRIPQRDGRGVKGCVKDDTLVLTKNGIVRADEVATDDYVWSHERRWAKVLGVDVFEDDDCYEMLGEGSPATVVNGRHAVYGQRLLDDGSLSTPSWATVQELRDGIPFSWNGWSWSGTDVPLGAPTAFSLQAVTPVGPQTVVNIVSADHSYLANGIFHHNTHPLWLESDEYQDYPKPGHTELIETLKRGVEGAVWRAHGVTRGVRDAFYDITSYANDMPPLRASPKRNEADWTVHRIVAMAREDWTDEERQEKIRQYGSKEDPDYRRNILGSHGDSTSAIFVISRLMKNVDDDPSSPYNTDEYYHFEVKDSEVENKGIDVADMLDFPRSHLKYKTTWAGADIGFVQDPTEILVFGEQPLTAEEKREMSSRDKAVPAEGRSRLKLLTRISMRRIAEPAQADVIMRVIEFYKPKAFAMDSTGVGLPLYQQVQTRMSDAADVLKSQRAREAAECIKPYNFSSKILVDFDETMTMPEESTINDKVKEAGIYRMVLEVSTDVLRTYVDEQRLWLPWDRELISEMQGQTFSYSKSQMDQYGRRRIFSKGTFHALDAMRMAALGHKQFALEALVNAKEPEEAPVLDVFMQF